MSGVTGQHPMPAPCPKCTGPGDAHYLTCPTLRYRPARIEPDPDQPGYNRGVWEPDDAALSAFDMAPGHGGW